MIASVYSTLNGKLVGKHPTLGVLVSEDGAVKTLKKGKRWSNPENKPTVDHYPNRDPTDNRLCNLRWADQKEQCRNTKSYDGALDLGVRKHDDPKEWDRRYQRYARANGLVKKLTPEQYERKKAQA